MKRILFLLAFGVFFATAYAQISYVDWTSQSGDTIFGTITLADSSTVNVEYTGVAEGYAWADVASTGKTDDYLWPDTYGDVWRQPDAPYNALPSQAPTSGFIVTDLAGSHTLTFSRPVDGLDMLLISVGQATIPVTYTFDRDFTVIDAGAGAWGGSTTSYTLDGSNSLTGSEFSGVIGFEGNDITSLTWTSATDEYFQGFTLAIASADNLGAVPEPATYALSVSLGLLGLAALRLRYRA